MCVYCKIFNLLAMCIHEVILNHNCHQIGYGFDTQWCQVFILEDFILGFNAIVCMDN